MLLDKAKFRQNQGRQLKKARKSAELTQEQVAVHFGVSQDLISKFERGIADVDGYRLLEFSKLYARPITFFFMEIPVKG